MESRDTINFQKEMSTLLDGKVKVLMKHKENYYLTGTLRGFSRKNESIFLTNAQDTLGNEFIKLVIHGDEWVTISLEETPFPMEGLFSRLKNVFPPGQVQYMPDIQAISVMGKINVTEGGVKGEGPLYDRVKKIYQQYVEDLEE